MLQSCGSLFREPVPLNVGLVTAVTSGLLPAFDSPHEEGGGGECTLSHPEEQIIWDNGRRVPKPPVPPAPHTEGSGSGKQVLAAWLKYPCFCPPYSSSPFLSGSNQKYGQGTVLVCFSLWSQVPEVQSYVKRFL